MATEFVFALVLKVVGKERPLDLCATTFWGLNNARPTRIGEVNGGELAIKIAMGSTVLCLQIFAYLSISSKLTNKHANSKERRGTCN